MRKSFKIIKAGKTWPTHFIVVMTVLKIHNGELGKFFVTVREPHGYLAAT